MYLLLQKDIGDPASLGVAWKKMEKENNFFFLVLYRIGGIQGQDWLQRRIRRGIVESLPQVRTKYRGMLGQSWQQWSRKANASLLACHPASDPVSPAGRDTALAEDSSCCSKRWYNCVGKKMPFKVHCVCSRRLQRRNHAGVLLQQPRA